MKRIGLVVKPDKKAMKAADDLANWLLDRKIKVNRVNLSDTQNKTRAWEAVPPDLLCVFVLGGDGTFLSAARWIGDSRIPLLGVKFGEVGFLADTQAQDLYEAAQSVVSGNFATRQRMRLWAKVIRGNETLAEETVLNDVVITKGALARLTDIETFIDGKYLTTYRADGLIVATPTGSTAYSLAAGGPVTHPEVSCILMTPICPFTLTNRPLIIPDTMEIEIRLTKDPADVMVTFDGQVGLALAGGDMIRIRKSPVPVDLVTILGHTYFDVLKTKLSWSGGRV